MTDTTCCKDELPPLPDNSSDRLREVAVIVREGDKYDQEVWAVMVDSGDEGDEIGFPSLLGKGNICGTRGCQAGWLVALTPPEQMPMEQVTRLRGLGIDYDWTKAGMIAGELEECLADHMFNAHFGEGASNDQTADFLEWLADLPAKDRNVTYVRANNWDAWANLVTYTVEYGDGPYTHYLDSVVQERCKTND